MDLTKILQTESALTAQVEYREGITFELRYISRASLQKMARQATIAKYDPKTKARTPQIENEKLIELYVRQAVVSWKGVTPRALAKIALVNFSAIPKEEFDNEVPFTVEGLIALVKASDDLDMFLQDTCSNVQTFNAGHEDELGNSEPSPSGN